MPLLIISLCLYDLQKSPSKVTHASVIESQVAKHYLGIPLNILNAPVDCMGGQIVLLCFVEQTLLTRFIPEEISLFGSLPEGYDFIAVH
jgi:hypothetical protein